MKLIEVLESMETLEGELTPKGYKKSGMDILKRIVEKLLDEISNNNIEVEDNKELHGMIEDAYISLEVYIHSRMQMVDEHRDYKKMLTIIVNRVKSDYGWVAEGSISSQYLALGLVFGSAFGLMMIALGNPAFMAIGTGCGLSMGVAIGVTKEKAAKESRKLY